MQQIPVAWVNPHTRLILGAGAYIQPEVLAREIELVERLTGRSLRDRLIIDHNAGYHDPEYAAESKQVNRHHLIGATGKGCAEAIVHKIKERNLGYRLFRDTEAAEALAGHFTFDDTRSLLVDVYHDGEKIQLEGTQGELLDFHFGPYPYTTSRQTIAAAWVAEAGLSPALKYEVILVARTHPIRVAGNSGPMPYEISWPMLANSINRKRRAAGLGALVDDTALTRWGRALVRVAQDYSLPLHLSPDGVGWGSMEERTKYRQFLSEGAKEAFKVVGPSTERELRKLFEVTTVTKKLRRIALLDREGLRATVRAESPAFIALTFLNYEFPEGYSTRAEEWIKDLETSVGAKIGLVNVGPQPRDIFAR